MPVDSVSKVTIADLEHVKLYFSPRFTISFSFELLVEQNV